MHGSGSGTVLGGHQLFGGHHAIAPLSEPNVPAEGITRGRTEGSSFSSEPPSAPPDEEASEGGPHSHCSTRKNCAHLHRGALPSEQVGSRITSIGTRAATCTTVPADGSGGAVEGTGRP